MDYVAVIVSERGLLSEDALADLRKNLGAAQDPVWLGFEEACEIPFMAEVMTKARRREMAAHLTTFLPNTCDLAILERANRRKKLVVSDMDATLIEDESLDELADEMGLKEKVAAITDRAMRGEIDFESALVERVALLKGLPLSALEHAMTRIRFSSGAETFIRTMTKHGAITALVSGGFTLFTSRVSAMLNMTHHRANTLEFDGDRLSGTITLPLLDKAAKRQALLAFCLEHGFQPSDALAIGDGSNDVDMIEEAGLGLGYRPKPLLVPCCDAQIMVCGLEAALFYQGFRRDEFAA